MRIKWLAICFSLSIVTVIILFILSPKGNIRQGFQRLIRDNVISLKEVKDVSVNSYYIAGCSDSIIYLGNVTTPLKVLQVSILKQESRHVGIRIPRMSSYQFQDINLSMDGSRFYVFDGKVPIILSGTIKDWVANPITCKTNYFLQCYPISDSSSIIRALAANPARYVLARQTCPGPIIKYFNEKNNLVQEEVFASDGMIQVSGDHSRILFLYRYKNQFVFLDTTLSVIYQGHTIDTTRRPQIQVSGINNNSSITYGMSAPPLEVNKRCSLSDSLLFVQSLIMGMKEDVNTFNKSEVIDVYNIFSGKYLYSFYLSKFKGNKLHDFKIYGRMLVVLYDHFFLRYELKG